MKLYLDTNILVFLNQKNYEDLHGDVHAMIEDYGNQLYAGAPCVRELMHLLQSGRLKLKSGRGALGVMPWLEVMGIEIVPVTKYHLSTYAELPLYSDHHDPDDRMIIAQAIRDKAILVSSDQKFSRYQNCGLQFIFNHR